MDRPTSGWGSDRCGMALARFEVHSRVHSPPEVSLSAKVPQQAKVPGFEG